MRCTLVGCSDPGSRRVHDLHLFMFLIFVGHDPPREVVKRERRNSVVEHPMQCCSALKPLLASRGWASQHPFSAAGSRDRIPERLTRDRLYRIDTFGGLEEIYPL
jgi:hypothetical protein